MIKAVIFDYGGVIFKNLRWHREMFDLARDLRAKGYKTALLSNMITPLAWITNHLASTKGFSPIVISSEVGHSKPNPEIYHIMLKRIGLKPEECLFIDDRQENLATAHSLGFQTMLVKKPKQTVKELRDQLDLN